MSLELYQQPVNARHRQYCANIPWLPYRAYKVHDDAAVILHAQYMEEQFNRPIVARSQVAKLIISLSSLHIHIKEMLTNNSCEKNVKFLNRFLG